MSLHFLLVSGAGQHEARKDLGWDDGKVFVASLWVGVSNPESLSICGMAEIVSV